MKTAILILLLFSAAPVEAQVRCVDAKGVAHWATNSNQFPEGCKSANLTLPDVVQGGSGDNALKRAHILELDNEIAHSQRKVYEQDLQPNQVKSESGPRTAGPQTSDFNGPTVCNANELRVMTGPGHWKVVGRCDSSASPVPR